MTENPHFAAPATWDEAAALVPFEPFTRDELGGRPLRSLAVFVNDHEFRDVAPGERSLEAYYDGFVFSQSRPGDDAARERAFEISYGRAPRDVELGGPDAQPSLRARVYELGPEPGPDDPDPRMPAVLAWADGEVFCLLASETLEADELIEMARSLYGNGD